MSTKFKERLKGAAAGFCLLFLLVGAVEAFRRFIIAPNLLQLVNGWTNYGGSYGDSASPSVSQETSRLAWLGDFLATPWGDATLLVLIAISIGLFASYLRDAVLWMNASKQGNPEAQTDMPNCGFMMAILLIPITIFAAFLL